MKRSMMKLIAVVIAILLALFVLFALRDTSTESGGSLLSDANALERHLEMGRHQNLQVVKNRAGSTLSDFQSDGCSGGLSVGWEYMAAKIPDFQGTHGDKPAWESCCKTHDRAYHTGATRDATPEMSFEARREADLALKECVIETGTQRSSALTKKYHISAAELEHMYNGIANMMYGAVRIGGMPCTDLPWRWGYGWPDCK